MVSRLLLIVAGCGSTTALLAGIALPSTQVGRTYIAGLMQRPQPRSGQDAGGTAGSVPPTRIGVNVTKIRYYSDERMFANLAIGSRWQSSERGPPGEDRAAAQAEYANRNGDLITLPATGEAVRQLTAPTPGTAPVAIRCSYRGSGDVTVLGRPSGTVANVMVAKGEVRFTWVAPNSRNAVSIRVSKLGAPISGLDCREATLSPATRFDSAFVNTLKQFAVARFMDWQNTNANLPVDWHSRHTPASIDYTEDDGAAIEDIIALSNAAGVAPWVNVPWNATDDYVRGFAQLMHDGIPADRPIHVEVANEVWNWQFPVARQASQEGQRAGLSTERTEAQLLRLAQRTTEVMAIWEQVFRDRPRQLVRVIALQNAAPRRAELAFLFPGLSEHVDAVASAPYFGNNLRKQGAPRDLDGVFASLNQSIDTTLDNARQFRGIAARYGKRYIAYEGGQHVVIKDDLALLTAIQRDPRMYGAYARYLKGWREEVGDLVTLYALTGRIGRSGAWGLAEYGGQAPSEAPKLRAVLEAARQR